MSAPLCPSCRLARPTGAARCPHCGLPLVGPVAGRLGLIDRRLHDLYAEYAGLTRRQEVLRGQRVALVDERHQVLAELRVWTPTAEPVVAAPTMAAPVTEGGPRPEATTRSVQNVLLALGGVLLGVAAIVFTVVAWGAFGLAGRATILAVITAVALATPVVLVRRGLAATAETIAPLALLLLALDGYAAWYVGLVPHGVPATTYAGLAALGVVGVAAAYPVVAPLAGPRPVALIGWHAVLPLLVADARPYAGTWALVLLAVLAVDLAAIVAGRGALRVAGWAGAAVTSPAISLSALLGIALDPARWIWLGPLALVALDGARLVAAEHTGARVRTVARAVAVTLGLFSLVAAAEVLLGRYSDLRWGVAVLAGVALLGAVGGRLLPRGWWHGAAVGGGILAGLAAVQPVLWTAGTLLNPVGWLDRPWTVATPATVASPTADQLEVDAVLALTAVLVAAAAVVLLHRWWGTRPLWPAGAATVAVLALLLPVAWAAPVAGVAAASGLAGGALLSLRRRPAFVVGAVLGAHALLSALANETTTLVALTAALLCCLALAAARSWQGAVGAGGAAVSLAGLAAAVVAAAAGTPAQVGAAVLLALVPAVAAVAVLPHRHGLVLAGVVPVVALAGAVPIVDAGRAPFALGLIAAAALGVAVAALLGGTARTVVSRLAAATAAGAGAALAVPALATIVLPWSWVTAVWSGAPARAGSGLATGTAWPGTAPDPLAVAALAAVTAGLVAVLRGRAHALPVAAPFLAVAIVELPLAADAPWNVGPAAMLVVAVAGAAAAAYLPRPWPIAGAVPAVAFGGAAVAWSLASRPATLVVLALVAAVAAVVTRTARTAVVRTGAAVAGGPALLGLGVTVAHLAGLRGPALAFGLVAAVGVLLAVARYSPVAEVLAGVGAGLAVVVAAPDTRELAVTLTVLGALAGASALRRRWYVYLAAGLELAALWTWLAVGGVTVPEAYTVPAAALALAVGLLRGRRLTSWVAYGPALAAAALPSTVLALTGDRLGLRALLLGVAALAVTLAGAVGRKQAPFVTGAAVLVLLAVRAVAAVLPELADAVPAWVPLSLGGILLVTVGATYERRRRDVHRFGSAVRRMG